MARKYRLLPAVLIFLVLTGPSFAQSPPTDLTDLNLEEILSLHIRRAGADTSQKSSRWSMGYRFVSVHFHDNRDGTDDVSLEEIIFRKDTEDRTSDNFPVVPLEIRQ